MIPVACIEREAKARANALSIAVISGFMLAAGLLTLALGHDPALEEGAYN